MLEGKVYKSTGSWYLVKSKNKFFECRIKGKIRLKDISTTNPISVGDDVIFEIEDQQFFDQMASQPQPCRCQRLLWLHCGCWH